MKSSLADKDRYLSNAYFADLSERLRVQFGERGALIEEAIQAFLDRHEADYDHERRE